MKNPQPSNQTFLNEFKLYPYQEEGIQWLKSKRLALLADEPGLGKTVQAITAADFANAKRVLVLCPPVARPHWVCEFAKYSSNKRNFVMVTKRGQKICDSDSIVCSYDLALTIDPAILGSFDLLILDESHFLKSPKAQRTQKIYGKKGFIRYAQKTWALSGTPATNHYGELWTLLYTFGQVPQSYEGFLRKYCIVIDNGYGPQVIGNRKERTDELREILKKIMLRRRVEEVGLQLPTIKFDDLVVEPGIVDLDIDPFLLTWVYPHDRSEELKNELKRQSDLILAATGETGLGRDGMKILEGMAKSVTTLRMYTGMQKVAPIAELVSQELESGAYDKIVIFAVHQNVIEGLRKRLSRFGAVTLYGKTPSEKRESHIRRFHNDSKCKVFIGNILACGTSVTLTASNQVLFVEQDWVPGNNFQAAKRCHRIGQTKPVFIRCASILGSYDQRISQILKRKMRELSELFDKEIQTI